MNRCAVRQQYHPQVASVHLDNWRPKANTAILLNDLARRTRDDALNPLQPDARAVWSLPHRMKILGELHGMFLNFSRSQSFANFGK